MKDYHIQEILKRIDAFCKDRNWDQFHTPKELAIGVVTESAELLDLFRFKSDVQISAMMKNDESRAKIGHELADVLYFLLRFPQLHNFNLLDEIDKKITINENRRYPVLVLDTACFAQSCPTGAVSHFS